MIGFLSRMMRELPMLPPLKPSWLRPVTSQGTMPWEERTGRERRTQTWWMSLSCNWTCRYVPPSSPPSHSCPLPFSHRHPGPASLCNLKNYGVFLLLPPPSPPPIPFSPLPPPSFPPPLSPLSLGTLGRLPKGTLTAAMFWTVPTNAN